MIEQRRRLLLRLDHVRRIRARPRVELEIKKPDLPVSVNPIRRAKLRIRPRPGMKDVPVLLDDFTAIAPPHDMNQERLVARLDADRLANQLRRAVLVQRRVRYIDKLVESAHPQRPRSVYPGL